MSLSHELALTRRTGHPAPTSASPRPSRVRVVGPAGAARPDLRDEDVGEVEGHERDWVAELHVTDLPHGLFPRLGVAFVRRWHRAHLASPHGTCLVARVGGVPVGFALCSLDRRAHVDWLLAHRRRELALPAAAALLRRPRLAVDFLRTRGARYARRLAGRGARPAAAAAPPTAVAVLDAIVVEEFARGRGVGTALVEAFLRRAVEAGAERAELVTKAGAAGAAGFYERRGWTRTGSHTDRDGEEVVTFRVDLTADHRTTTGRPTLRLAPAR
ncbi:GNAT family N-acetyltransferase [Nocardioides sp. CPCC 205120]|uniref:GNAT family N-acetyltransferase n=1 Tax=Nocardioides sp. CPCC 205120 TaxID=3406462 RepID=UPI003B5116F3